MQRVIVIPILVFMMGGLQGGCGEKPGPQGSDGEGRSEIKSVKRFLKNYFKTWSDADYRAYEACFDPAAAIHFRRENGELRLHDLKGFMDIQRRVHKKGDGKVEIPLETKIAMENGFARCLVRWQLTDRKDVKKGYDHFLLTKDGDSWKIVSLLFYNDP